MKKTGLRIGIVILFLSLWVSCGIKSYAAEVQQIEVKEIYHVHTGNSSSGGGCYTVPTIKELTCTYRYVVNGSGAYNTWIECACGGGYSGGAYTIVYIENGCGNHQNFQKGGECPYCGTYNGHHYTTLPSSHSYQATVYELGCGQDETVPIGEIILEKEVGAGQYLLKVSGTDSVDITSCLWSTGESSETLTVTGNGTYSCTINYSESGRSDIASFTYEVTDYDVTPPNVEVLYDDSTWSQSKTISVDATDEGVGLHAQAYRYHNGIEWSEWSASNTYTITLNGTYLIEVRDAIGNITQDSVTITKIDITGPNCTYSYDDSTWSQSKTITVNATDEGVGLHTEAYRFQGGEWESDKLFSVSQNGTYQIEVRDALGNMTSHSIIISHIDNQAPDVVVGYDDSTWSKKKTISITALDNGSGLAVNAYRFNQGDWGNLTEYEVIGNGTYIIEVIDTAGNVALMTITITRIDNESPGLEISCDDSTWSKTKIITVSASDRGSGLDSKAYRFYNGVVWSEWSNQTEYEVAVNNKYLFEVMDILGNVTQKSIVVSMIDHKGPAVSATVSDAELWRRFKTVTVNAIDESGISKYEYSYDGSQWYSGSNTWQVEKSGWVYYKVTDNAGNVASSVVQVSMIDMVAPQVKLNTKEACAGIVIVDATDAEAGLETAAYAYSRDGKQWSDWTSSKKFIVKDNGHLYVKVRDKAGNIAGGEENQIIGFYIELDKEPPKVEIILSDDGKYLIISAEDSNLAEKPYQYGEEEWTNENTYLIEEIDEKLVIKVRDIAGNATKVTYVKPGIAASFRKMLENENLQKVAAVTTGTTSTMTVTFGFVFLFMGFGNVKVYGFDDKGKRIFLYYVSISKKGNIKISKYRLKKNKTNTILMKPNAGVLKKRNGEMISIQIGNNSFSKIVQKEITLTY